MMTPYRPYSFNTPATVKVFTIKETLPDLGKPHFEKKIADNHFARFDFENQTVYRFTYPGRNEVRLVTCPHPAYKDRAENNSAQPPIGPTTLYQLDLDNRRIDCGMSYLYRLADGRFFLIDGGYFTPHECDRLYQLIRTLQPHGKLAIAGWFFSHAHQDHFGCFIEFILKYHDDCHIEALYYTFPSLSLPEASRFKQSDNATMREFDYTVDLVLPNVKHIHPHTGDTFTLSTLTLEVLFTHEDIYPETIGSFNDTSTVLRITEQGQSILFLGDLQDASCRKLNAMWGSYLKSDIVQVAHHGFNGSTVETYDLISPEVALWPTPDYGYDGNKEREVNAHLIHMTSIREHIIAGIHKTQKLSLPYQPNTSKPIPD